MDLVTFPYLYRSVSVSGQELLLSNPWVKRTVSGPRSLAPLLDRLTTPHTRDQIGQLLDGGIDALQPLFDARILVRQEEATWPTSSLRPVRVCLAAMVRQPGPELASFLRYHFAIGFAHAFIFFDDPEDPALTTARAFPQVTALPVDASVRRRWRELRLYPQMGPYVDTEVSARQGLNIELALSMARELGMDWLLHVDDDELFHAPDGVEAYFGRLPDEVGMISFATHEAAPEVVDAPDRFRAVSLFKKNPVLLDDEQTAFIERSPRRSYFNAYTSGKSAVRLAPGALPFTNHGFRPPTAHPLVVGLVPQPAILHYVNASLSSYLKKYRMRGKFSDLWMGQIDLRTEAKLTFHVESRDRLAAGDLESLENFYRESCVYSDPDERQQLLEVGILTRISGPARVLEAGQT